jgi:hypothetical protein
VTERKEAEEQNDLSSASNDALVGCQAPTFGLSFLPNLLEQKHVDISPTQAWLSKLVKLRYVMQGSDHLGMIANCPLHAVRYLMHTHNCGRTWL